MLTKLHSESEIFLEVAEDLSAGISGRHFHSGIGYVTKVEGTGSNIISKTQAS